MISALPSPTLTLSLRLSLTIQVLMARGDTAEVRWLLDQLRASGHSLNQRTLNILLRGFVDTGSLAAALEVFNTFDSASSAPGLISYNILMDGFAKCGQWLNTKSLFQQLRRQGLSPDMYTYNALMRAAISSGLPRRALAYYRLFAPVLMKPYTPPAQTGAGEANKQAQLGGSSATVGVAPVEAVSVAIALSLQAEASMAVGEPLAGVRSARAVLEVRLRPPSGSVLNPHSQPSPLPSNSPSPSLSSSPNPSTSPKSESEPEPKSEPELKPSTPVVE